MMYHGYYYGDGGAHPLFWVLLCIVAVAFLGTLVWVVMSLSHQRSVPVHMPPASCGAEALRILDERFARGEIEEDEYTKRRALLRN
jgi:putative membrane protein